MKSKLLGLALFTATAAAVALMQTPPVTDTPSPSNTLAVASPNGQSMIEVVFVLDTTGSMSGLIQAAKEKIWSIANSMVQAESAPLMRMGLVAYRDRGDDYVTRVYDLSTDLDTLYATLMDFKAGGGGDGPESVNKALQDAVQQMSWSEDRDSYRVLFLVGDAPPHMDYQDEPQYPQIAAVAKAKGIVINTIQAGTMRATTAQWQRIAALGAGEYFQVEPSGNVVAIATPYDERLAKLSKALDDTRLYYGDAKIQAEKARKQAAAEKLHRTASLESRARRAAFNATASGKANLLGDQELVNDLASGRVELDELEPEELPAPLRSLAPEAQKKLIQETTGRRQALQREVETLARERREYLEQEVARGGGAKDSLDAKIYGAVRAQAQAKGLKYETMTPAY